MGISRRNFTALLGSSLLGGSLFSSTLLASGKETLFASASQTSSGLNELLIVDKQGVLRFRHALPARSHHIAAHPQLPLLAAVGRRPETYIDIVNYESKQLVQRIQSRQGQHFYGHAIFSPDGRYLISTENQMSTGDGLIVIRNVHDNFNTIKQFSSAGIGPHELRMMPDGKTLVIANGGIHTHPEQGRAKLNLSTMQPSLAYIDSLSGKLQEQVFLTTEHHQLSIRHLDVNAQGRVGIALQYQGDTLDDMPLVAFHSQGEAIKLVKAPTPINHAMKQYCGSIRFDRSGETVAVSSPRGDLITFWKQNGDYLNSIKTTDGCGLTATSRKSCFLISTGRGRFYHYDVSTRLKKRISLELAKGTQWDNHLTNIS